MTFIATLKGNGQLDFGSPANETRWRVFCQDNKGKKVRIDMPKAKRSLSQNNYFWKYLEIIEENTGNDSKTLHEYIKKHLTPKVERTVRLIKDGKWIEHTGMDGKGTSELTKSEMSDTLDKLAALTGVPLPDPSELENFISNY